MTGSDLEQALAELVGEVGPTGKAMPNADTQTGRQGTIDPRGHSEVPPTPRLSNLAPAQVEIIPPTHSRDMACLGCGVVREYHRAVGFPCCSGCLKRLGAMTWEERVLIHKRLRTIDQILAERTLTRHGPVRDRLHVPPLFAGASAEGAVAAWAIEPRGALVLHGLPGRGKSHQACGALKAVLERRAGDAYLVNCAGLGRMGRDEFRVWTECTALALDDLGARLTPAAMAAAYELIEARHASRKPLVVTTNITAAGVMELDARIGSRLGGGTWVEMSGHDRRLQ